MKAALTTVATVGAGDELLRPLVAILLLGAQAEAADGDGLRHRLMSGMGGETVSQLNSLVVQMKATKRPRVS